MRCANPKNCKKEIIPKEVNALSLIQQARMLTQPRKMRQPDLIKLILLQLPPRHESTRYLQGVGTEGVCP